MKSDYKHTFASFCSNTSILFKKSVIGVRANHRELTTVSKSARLCAILFCSQYQLAAQTSDTSARTCVFSSPITSSYSLSATQKMTLSTLSKQWIHLRGTPPRPLTSKILILYHPNNQQRRKNTMKRRTRTPYPPPRPPSRGSRRSSPMRAARRHPLAHTAECQSAALCQRNYTPRPGKRTSPMYIKSMPTH